MTAVAASDGTARDPELVLAGPAAAYVQLVAAGGLPGEPGFLDGAERAAVRRTGALADGRPWPASAVLPVPAAVAASVAERGRLTLVDSDGTPLAAVSRPRLWTDDAGVPHVAGPVTLTRPRTAAPAPRPHRPTVAVPLSDVPGTAELAALAGAAAGADLVLMPRVAEPGPLGLPADGLVRAVEAAAAAALPRGTRVQPVPLLAEPDPVGDAALAARVAQAYGADSVVLLGPAPPGVGPTGVGPTAPLPVTWLGAPRPSVPEITGRLDRGEPVGEHLLPGPAARVLAAYRPPLSRRGIVVLFTGLSGAGKSTIARALAGALPAAGRPKVTLLDGDVVRRMLSSELTFSAEHRDLNVRRIGYVAAEVARHGGVAICAPIAPYAASRLAVREMVEAAGGLFLLVYVATGIEVCEERDIKGLYRRARAGQLVGLTGVDDPYEVPGDSDLVLDGGRLPVAAAVDAVLDTMHGRGWLSRWDGP